jgi:hypothetical protein
VAIETLAIVTELFTLVTTAMFLGTTGMMTIAADVAALVVIAATMGLAVAPRIAVAAPLKLNKSPVVNQSPVRATPIMAGNFGRQIRSLKMGWHADLI